MARESMIGLIVAAGSGSRAGGDVPKQFRRIAGRTVLDHAIAALRNFGISRIFVVTAPGQENSDTSGAISSPFLTLVAGGSRRQDSVRNGLEAIAAAGGADFVLIHDAARPFLPPSVITRLLAALADVPAAVPVLPVTDTLASGGSELGDTVAREALVRVQTPQAFRFDAILSAHRSWDPEVPVTDDAQIARSAGLRVAMVEGDPMLEKLTYEHDLERAERLQRANMVTRTGIGFDVHSFCEGDHVWLGGIRVDHDRALAGHSDADVALHALTDALLGAAAEGDIGDHFPPTDPQWRGANSSRFVEHACKLIRDRGGLIDHVDLILICERPKVGPYKPAIRSRLAALLAIGEDRISVKATTTEKLGFTGRSEGIAAQAVATVRIEESK